MVENHPDNRPQRVPPGQQRRMKRLEPQPDPVQTYTIHRTDTTQWTLTGTLSLQRSDHGEQTPVITEPNGTVHTISPLTVVFDATGEKVYSPRRNLAGLTSDAHNWLIANPKWDV